MNLADPWYASGTFWTAAGAVAVLVTGAIATYVTFTLANPVRRLECSMSTAPLLQGSAQEMPGTLQITWKGEELNDPHILEVTLTSRGRRDIAKEDFDQALEFRVGAKILAVLRSASGPNATVFRAVDFEDDLLKVGPGLIRRHQSIRFTLLAVGHNPELSSSAAAVRDVDVKVLTSEPSSHRWSTGPKVAAGLAVAAAMAGLVLIGLVIGHSSVPSKTSPTASKTSTPASSSAVSGLRAAEADMKSSSRSAQLTGIGMLQYLMKTVPADQSAAMQALDMFIQARSPAGNNDQQVTSVIQAALTVLRDRNPANDDGFIINLSNANLTSADLNGIDFNNAQLVNTDFDTANLTDASFRYADLNYAFIGGANITGASFDDANLSGASFYDTTSCRGSAPTDPQLGYNCSANG
jgi:hypothetical protein